MANQVVLDLSNVVISESTGVCGNFLQSYRYASGLNQLASSMMPALIPRRSGKWVFSENICDPQVGQNSLVMVLPRSLLC